MESLSFCPAEGR